jgi:hypothetical protein
MVMKNETRRRSGWIFVCEMVSCWDGNSDWCFLSDWIWFMAKETTRMSFLAFWELQSMIGLASRMLFLFGEDNYRMREK